MNEVIYQGISHDIKELLLGGMSAKYLFKWILSLLIVPIFVESVSLRSMKLNCCIIDYFYATLLLRKAQWAYPTVHRNWVFKTRLGSFVTGGFLGALVLTAFMVVSSELPRQRTRGMQDLVRGWWEWRASGTRHRDHTHLLGNAAEGPGKLTPRAFQTHLIT